MTDSDRDLGRIEGRLGAVEERQTREAQDAKADIDALRLEMRQGFAELADQMRAMRSWQDGITGGKRALIAAAGLLIALAGAAVGYLRGMH